MKTTGTKKTFFGEIAPLWMQVFPISLYLLFHMLAKALLGKAAGRWLSGETISALASCILLFPVSCAWFLYRKGSSEHLSRQRKNVGTVRPGVFPLSVFPVPCPFIIPFVFLLLTACAVLAKGIAWERDWESLARLAGFGIAGPVNEEIG